MSHEIPTTKLTWSYFGVPTEIEIVNDIPWGSFQKLLSGSEVNGKFDFNNFVDLLLEEVIVGGVDPKNRTEWKKVPTLEMTELIGKVGEILPLETYFKNLKLDQGGIVGALTNPQN